MTTLSALAKNGGWKALTHSNLLRLVLFAVLLQLFYWLVFVPNFVTYRADNRPEFIELLDVEQAELTSPDAAGIAAAQFEPYDPELRLVPRGYHATAVTFTLETVPETGLALLDQAAGDHIRFYVNGSLLSAKGEARLPHPTYHGLQKRITAIPAGLLHEGENRIVLVSTWDITREGTVNPPLLADYEATEAAFAWTDFLFNDWRNITITVAFVVALLVGAAALRASNRALPVWLFLLTLSWAMLTLFYRWIDFPLSGNARGLFYAVVFLFMSACWPAFVDAWTQKPLRFFKPAMMAIFAVGALLATYWMLIERSDLAFNKVEDLLDKLGFVLVIATIGRLVWHFVRNPDEDRTFEGAVLILLASLIAFFLYNTWFHDRNVGHLPAAQPLLLLALAVGFFARNFRLFRSQNEINRLLQDKLDLREAELAESHAREKLWVREQTLVDERRRIMRDMHDGLGSQLMGMLLAARRGKAEPQKVAEGLQQVVDEMRLMIDSMDSVGESLGAGLAGFRTRLQPRVEDAGFAFRWDNRLGDDLPPFPARKTLQLFRIIQEAVNNALKHSGGSEVAILLERDETDPGTLRVLVQDDGKGFAGTPPGGHGLGNMRARAAQVGGDVQFDTRDGGGTVVTIVFPVEHRPADMP